MMGSASDWRSATEMGFTSDGQRWRWVMTEMDSVSDGDEFFAGIQTLREITCHRGGGGVAENTGRGGKKGKKEK
jgi:hypothetical protein